MSRGRLLDKEYVELIRKNKDFFIRDYEKVENIPPKRYVLLFIVLLLITVLSLNVVMYNVLTLNVVGKEGLAEKIVMMMVLSTISMITIYLLSCKIIKKVTTSLMISEFLNLLLSSSMRSTSCFSIIVNRDKKVFYVDCEFAEFFKITDKGGELEKLIELCKLGEDFSSAVETSESFDAVFEVGEKKYSLKAEPLARPKDCMVIRGYELE